MKEDKKKTAPLILFSGPCVIESEGITFRIAEKLKDIASRWNIDFYFKASFDKANRSAGSSFRGPGMKRGLEILSFVKEKLNIPIISDIHTEAQVGPASEVLDIIQIPAFLCRQTDLLVEAAKSGIPVNVKKGQFVSPRDMKNVVDKLESSGCERVFLTERGTTFGYNNLVNDFRSIPIMKSHGAPVIFDATHSVQKPGGKINRSDGEAQFVVPLSRAAIACGADGLFIETHEDPAAALSDGPNMLPLDEVETLLETVLEIRKAVLAR